MRIAHPLLALAILIGSAPALRSNEANYQDHLMGARAAGMGGAACALGTSVDACYYNPAGLSFSERSTVSISANLYGFQRYQTDHAIFPDEDYTSDSFISIPSTMGGVMGATDRLHLAFAAFIPNQYSIAELVAFPDSQHFFKYHYDDQTLWVGPSAAWRVTPTLSVGGSLYGVYRTLNESMSLYMGPQGLSYSRYFKYSTFGALGQAGAQFRPSEHLRLGLSLRSPSLNLYGDGDYETDATLSDPTGGGHDFRYVTGMDAENRIPPSISLGCGWEVKRRYAVGLDVTYHGANRYNRLEGRFDDGTPAVVGIRNEAVLDINAGAEYYLLPTLPLRAGFFTSRSAAPDIDLSEPDNAAPIDLYGYSASVGLETTNVTTTIGMTMSLGSGDDLGYEKQADGSTALVRVRSRERNLYLFFATAYQF